MKGLPVPSLKNNQLEYKCKGVWSFYATLITSAALHYYKILPLGSIIDSFGPLLSVSIITGFAVTIITYIIGVTYKLGHRLSGNPLYDMFMGVILNPRLGPLDLKMWAEIRIPWIILFYISVSAAVKNFETTGTLSPNLAFMVLAHFLYVNGKFYA